MDCLKRLVKTFLRSALFSTTHFCTSDVDSATPTLNSSDSPIHFWARVILQCIELKEHDISIRGQFYGTMWAKIRS